MATTAESIREELEKKADRRINPLLKGLSMLTGGIAGELTGTNEQMRQQRRARAALLEDQQRQMAEQRVAERVKLQREEELKDSIKRAAIEREAAALDEARRLQGETMVARGEDATMVGPLDPQTALGVARARAAAAKDPRRQQLIGALSAERGPLEVLAEQQGLTTPIADLDINALERMNAAMTASIEAKKREPKGISMQLMTPRGMVYGTYDELASKYPNEVKNIMEAKPEKAKDIEPSVRAAYDEYGNVKPFVDFPPGYPIERQGEFLEKVRKAYNISPVKNQDEPAPGTPKIIGQGPTSAPGAPQVSRFGGTRAAATTPAAAAPIMGTPTAEEGPSIWNTNVPGFERGYGLVPDMPPGGFKPTLKDVTPTMPTTEGIREFLSPFVQMASRSTGELAPPIPTRRSSEMFADPEAYKQYLRKQMGGY